MKRRATPREQAAIPILARAIGRTPEAVRDACERVNGRAVGVGVFEETE
jgi:hypothetical protein